MSTKNTVWYINNAGALLMIALSVTGGLVHALNPEYEDYVDFRQPLFPESEDRIDQIKSILEKGKLLT